MLSMYDTNMVGEEVVIWMLPDGIDPSVADEVDGRQAQQLEQDNRKSH